jgi:hypothetical protein
LNKLVFVLLVVGGVVGALGNFLVVGALSG